MAKKESTTKEKIFNHAMALFKERSYNDVTIDDICAAAEIARGTFYYNFVSKEALLNSFFDDLKHLSKDSLPSILSAPNSWEQIWSLTQISHERVLQAGSDIFTQILKTTLDSDQSLIEIFGEDISWFVPLIEKSQNAGEIRNRSNPLRLYQNIINLSNGIALLWCIQKEGFDLMIELRKAFESLLDIRPDLRTYPDDMKIQD